MQDQATSTEGGTAFPWPGKLTKTKTSVAGMTQEIEVECPGSQPGMSLRQFYAGQALNGMLAGRVNISANISIEQTTTLAFVFADAMLRAMDAPTDTAAAAEFKGGTS